MVFKTGCLKLCDSQRNRGANLLSPVCREPSISCALIRGWGLARLVGPAHCVQTLAQESVYCFTWSKQSRLKTLRKWWLLLRSRFFKRAQHRGYRRVREGPSTADNRASRGCPGGSAVKNPPASAGGVGSSPESGRSPGGGHSSPLQDSSLEKPTDRGAWWVQKSQTRLSN